MDVHDCAARLLERGDGGLRYEERGLQVDRDLPIEIRDGALFHRTVRRQPARHIHDCVQATEVPEGGLDREGRDVGLGEISGAGLRLDAKRFELLHPRGNAHRIAVARNDPCAGPPEGEGNRIPDLSGPSDAGHENDLAAKVVVRAGSVGASAHAATRASSAPSHSAGTS
jgi:hypothetical protein